MILYQHSSFGFKSLTRVQGSAVCKAILPALLSTVILIVAVYGFDLPIKDNGLARVTRHPYAIQAVIAFFTFLITFRANFAYHRYWEACTAVHFMMSKWLDVGMNMAAHHYQAAAFEGRRPPTFGRDLRLGGDCSILRERLEPRKSEKEYRASLKVHNQNKTSLWQRKSAKPSDITPSLYGESKSIGDAKTGAIFSARAGMSRLRSQARLDGGMDSKQSPFLEEAAHLLSLLSAVALSTLRNDLEGTESPLIEFEAGKPWPDVDPGNYTDASRGSFDDSNAFWEAFYHVFGISRSDRHRTLYNASRPFRVIGGVSEEEIEMLHLARGPYAKTAVCFMWLQEFFTREHLAGGTGPVHAAIISRLHQFSSDGMRGYNDARKTAYIPFPFPHAQLTVVFIVVVAWVFPFLYWSYVNNMVLACFLNFTTVLCFVGLHEVARELENPFRNVPNDLPLMTFQALFNEALLTMFAGFHPDAWWQEHCPEDDQVERQDAT